MGNIKIEEIVKLKEQGWSLRKIQNYLKEIGENISYEAIRKRINKYYISIGEVKEKIEINDEELVQLKEKRMSDREIAEYLTKTDRKISTTAINRRLKKYYESVGKPKPRKVSDEEVAALKEQGMRDIDIVEYLTKQGIKISINGVTMKLRRYYKSIGKERPRVKTRKRKLKQEQLQTENKSSREEFSQSIRVSTPLQTLEPKNISSENVVNYSREDEER